MKTLITNIGQLVTPESRESGGIGHEAKLTILRDSSLLIRNGRIASIGATRTERVDQTVDAQGRAVLPGLVDPGRNYRTYVGASLPDAERQELLLRALNCAAASGLTTVGVKCREGAGVFDELSLLKHAARGSVPRIVASLFCSPDRGDPDEAGGHLSSMIGRAIPTVRTRRLAQFCDVALGDAGCSIAEGRAILRAARGAGLELKVSADGGDVDEALRLAAQLDVTSVGFCATPAALSIERLQSVDVVPVVLPARSFVTGSPQPNIRPMLEQGLSVALGTDQGRSTPGAASIWMLVALALTQLQMTLDEALTACTYNSARALGLGSEVGTLEIGKKADLIILDINDHRRLLDELGRNPVRLTMVDGRIIHQS